MVIKWIFEVRNNSERFLLKVSDISIVCYDRAWKCGEESEERAAVPSLNSGFYYKQLNIYGLNIPCDFVHTKKTYRNKAMLHNFVL